MSERQLRPTLTWEGFIAVRRHKDDQDCIGGISRPVS